MGAGYEIVMILSAISSTKIQKCGSIGKKIHIAIENETIFSAFYVK
jgi:hypothetical protein